MKTLRFLPALLLVAFAVPALFAIPARAEDGYEAWLRYRPLDAAGLSRTAPLATALMTGRPSPTLDAAALEMVRWTISPALRAVAAHPSDARSP